jgi:mono/diheme cytochrome c family protein
LTRPSRLHRRGHALTPALAVLIAAGIAAGCGTGGVDRNSNASNGKQLFVSRCGSCHTLADAGTLGKVGPNLDDAFASDRKQGFSESTVRQVVRDQIHFPSPAAGNSDFPVMPPNLVTGTDADSVAAYVASVAGVPSGGTSTSSAAPPPPSPPPPPTTTSQQTSTAQTTTSAQPPGGNAGNGKRFYASLGCSGCHTLDGSKGTGPTFKGLYGSQVQLTTGKSVAADPAYLLQSIEDPDALIVQGYQPGIMSGVIKPHQVSTADANDLVAYIKTLK